MSTERVHACAPNLIRPPHATTVRLALAAADGDALDRAIGDFLQERKAQDPTLGRAPPHPVRPAAQRDPEGCGGISGSFAQHLTRPSELDRCGRTPNLVRSTKLVQRTKYVIMEA
ncbi:hypothetical protein GCM10009536_06330 [Streptomyces thermocarboxydus]|nr:hypothetical protein E7X38_10585 [Streptomyces sp. Akac8]